MNDFVASLRSILCVCAFIQSPPPSKFTNSRLVSQYTGPSTPPPGNNNTHRIFIFWGGGGGGPFTEKENTQLFCTLILKSVSNQLKRCNSRRFRSGFPPPRFVRADDDVFNCPQIRSAARPAGWLEEEKTRRKRNLIVAQARPSDEAEAAAAANDPSVSSRGARLKCTVIIAASIAMLAISPRQ